MSATPPEANTEYSRAQRLRKGLSARRNEPRRARQDAADSGPAGARGLVLAGGALGALLLIVAEFTTLYAVHVATSTSPVKEVSSGSNHGYAMIPIALLAVALAFGVFRYGSRTALLAIGVLGVISLLIALLGDLPDARASGLVGSAATHYINASSTPSAGLYMETLGAVVLITTCGTGFLLLGAPHVRIGRPRGDGRHSDNG